MYEIAQPATQKRTPLGIEPFWGKPSAYPPLKWEKWRMQAKLALFAKENITLDILLEQKPENIQPQPENTARINLREHNNGFLSSIGTRKVGKKPAIENELGKLMSETNGDRKYVWRQARDTGRPKNCFNDVP